MEFPLQTTAAEEKILATRLRAAGHIYNAVLGEALRVLDLMRESKEWQAARALCQDPEGRAAHRLQGGAGAVPTSGRR
ncbi:MAG TPA: hypothetical protein VMK12_18000 [Anaeromyxobacteraceae bacterium]|nr:hypothetical protein [Anaeromyxobacteraceae bacterium]